MPFKSEGERVYPGRVSEQVKTVFSISCGQSAYFTSMLGKDVDTQIFTNSRVFMKGNGVMKDWKLDLGCNETMTQEI